MEKNLKREEIGCMWMFISLFGSNQKRLLMDHKHGRSKRFSGNYGCESDDVQKLINDNEDNNTDVSDESDEKFSEIIKRLIEKKEVEIQTCKDLLEAFNVLSNNQEESFKKREEAVLVVPRKKCKLFSRKWRLDERRRDRDRSQIVVLRPSLNSVDIDCSSGNKKSKKGRSISRFLIGLIKRRLHSSIGKKSCSKTEKHVSDNQEEDHNVEDSKKIMSGLYIAAKKHLAEMLANGDIDVSLADKEVPRILGKILSLPEFASPVDSPRLIPGHDSVSNVSPLSQTQCSSTTNDHEDSDKDDETLFTIDVSVPKDYDEKEEKISVSRQVESADENVLDFLEEDEEDKQAEIVHSPSSPPHSSVRLIECKETATDVFSPVSVLDPLFTDDDNSPRLSTRFGSAGTRIMQPLCIRFDEADSQEPNKHNMDEKELAFTYIETVVKSSGLTFQELLTRPFFSDQLLLEPGLIDDDIVFIPTELCDDKNLLYDCINEVLMEFSENELNPGPWISFLKPQVRLVSDTETTVKVAQEGVYWHLLPLPSPHTLDQIVSKDMAKTGSWMDLRFDIGYIASVTSEIILDELVEEIITSYTPKP